METIFKKGDKVFCMLSGWGIVTGINISEYPIEVDFDKQQHYTYSRDGRVNQHSPRTLSFTEYTLEGFSQERPEELPKKGDIVWVRDYKNEEWKITHFIGLHPTSSYKYRVSRINSYSNTIDYMYMTTTNPYANEHN